nr:unnamed protein product [Callosobruchus chinensis]
MSSNSSASIMS